MCSSDLTALGGMTAIEQISSRSETGAWDDGSARGEFETFVQSPGRYTFVRHSTLGNGFTLLDGAIGQIASPGHTAHEMTEAEKNFAAMDADLQRPLHLRTVFRDLRQEYPEKIGDNETLVIVGELSDDRSVKFYFDRSSKLLVREVRLAESTLGRIPTQIDYADYRGVDGVQIPIDRKSVV